MKNEVTKPAPSMNPGQCRCARAHISDRFGGWIVTLAGFVRSWLAREVNAATWRYTFLSPRGKKKKTPRTTTIPRLRAKNLREETVPTELLALTATRRGRCCIGIRMGMAPRKRNSPAACGRCYATDQAHFSSIG